MEDDIVAVGGTLDETTLLTAYRKGIFPWPAEGLPLLWYCPLERAILRFDPLELAEGWAERHKDDEVDYKGRRVTLTDAGFATAADLLGVADDPLGLGLRGGGAAEADFDACAYVRDVCGDAAFGELRAGRRALGGRLREAAHAIVRKARLRVDEARSCRADARLGLVPQLLLLLLAVGGPRILALAHVTRYSGAGSCFATGLRCRAHVFGCCRAVPCAPRAFLMARLDTGHNDVLVRRGTNAGLAIKAFKTLLGIWTLLQVF